jgi:hypothetical protein
VKVLTLMGAPPAYAISIRMPARIKSPANVASARFGRATLADSCPTRTPGTPSQVSPAAAGSARGMPSRRVSTADGNSATLLRKFLLKTVRAGRQDRRLTVLAEEARAAADLVDHVAGDRASIAAFATMIP